MHIVLECRFKKWQKRTEKNKIDLKLFGNFERSKNFQEAQQLLALPRPSYNLAPLYKCPSSSSLLLNLLFKMKRTKF